MGQSFNQNLESLMSNMEKYATSKTVIGDPVTFGNIVIVPLVDVTFGAGAGEREKGSSGGMGAKISPSAVLVVVNDTVQLVNVKNQDSVNKLIDLVPGVLAKFGSFFNKDKNDQADLKDL